jgi:hypothetical protein
MNAAASTLLPPEFVAMIDKGVSAIASSRDLANRPSIMRAVGSAISADGGQVTVYLARSQSRQLLDDVAATGQIAVVFSRPASHRTVQLKSSRASIRDALPADAAVLQRYVASMEQEIGQVGFGPTFVRAMLAHPLDELVAISFEPEQAFDQTPGPKAGAPLASMGGGSTP